MRSLSDLRDGLYRGNNRRIWCHWSEGCVCIGDFTSLLFDTQKASTCAIFYTFTDGFFDAELQIFDIVGFQGEEWEMDLWILKIFGLQGRVCALEIHFFISKLTWMHVMNLQWTYNAKHCLLSFFPFILFILAELFLVHLLSHFFFYQNIFIQYMTLVFF